MSIRTTLACATILTTIAIAGHAQSISQQVVDQLTEQGYSRIEVKTRDNQVKVEAIRGDRQLEVTYDATTGDILKQEVNSVEDRDGMMNGTPRDDEHANEASDDHRGQGRGRGRGGDHAEDDDDDGMQGDDDDHGRHGGDRASDDDGDDHESGNHGGRGGDNASGGDDNGGKSDGGRHGGRDDNDDSDDD